MLLIYHKICENLFTMHLEIYNGHSTYWFASVLDNRAHDEFKLPALHSKHRME